MEIKLKKIKDDCYHFMITRRVKPYSYESRTYEITSEELKDFCDQMGLDLNNIMIFLETGDVSNTKEKNNEITCAKN